MAARAAVAVQQDPSLEDILAADQAARQAVLARQERVPAGQALGRVCALPTVACPPAIPIAVSGEAIGPAAVELFRLYGVEQVAVLTE